MIRTGDDWFEFIVFGSDLPELEEYEVEPPKGFED